MRYVLIGVGVLVVLVGAVVVIGWSLPVHHRVMVSRVYHATPAALYALITDVRGFPAWRSDLKGVEALSDSNGAHRWRETPKNGSPITFVVDRSIPDQLLVSRIADTDLPFGGSWSYELKSPTPGQTALTITEDGDVYNPVFRFASRFVMGHTATIERYLDDVANRFAPVADTSGPSSG